MRRFTIGICIMLIVGHLLLESGAAYQIYKDYETIYVMPFLSPSYHWPYENGISLYHWIQMNCTELLWCITFFVLAKVAHKYSYKLFLVGCIFFVYHVADYFMMWWDFKTSVLFYYFLNGAILVAIACLFIPEKKRGNVVSFD